MTFDLLPNRENIAEILERMLPLAPEPDDGVVNATDEILM